MYLRGYFCESEKKVTMLISSNWLLVMGTDRNAGKTSLICQVIQQYRNENGLTAIKISPHFHRLDKDEKILSLTDEYVIVEETKPETGKDSSRMLSAGAERVLYVQVWDQKLEKALMEIRKFLDPSAPVICESGWLRNILKPGAFAIVNRKGNDQMKESISRLKPLADVWFEFDGTGFDPSPSVITLEGNSWKINP